MKDMTHSVGMYIEPIPLSPAAMIEHHHQSQNGGSGNKKVKEHEDLSAVDACLSDSWSRCSLVEQCSISSPHSAASSSMSSAREALKNSLFSPHKSVSLRRKASKLKKNEDKTKESPKSPNLAPIIVTRKPSTRRHRTTSGVPKQPNSPPPSCYGTSRRPVVDTRDDLVSPTTVTTQIIGEDVLLQGETCSATKGQQLLQTEANSVQTKVTLLETSDSGASDDCCAQTTTASSSIECSSENTNNKRRVQFNPIILRRRVDPLDTLTDDPRSIWYQEDEFEAIIAKIHKIVLKVRAEGLERKPGQRKITCIRGLERLIEQEHAQEMRSQAMESVLSLQMYSYYSGTVDPEALAEKYKAATEESLVEALDWAEVDESDAAAYYYKNRNL